MLNKRILNRLFALLAIAVLVPLCGCQNELAGVLNPKGVITFEERQLMFDALALMLIVVLPVIIMSIAFIWRYHQSQDASEYLPNWSHNTMLESIWWGVPIAIILILGVMTWTTSHELDPYKPISAPGETLQVQVVALPWKWLFIYPQQNVASVNFLELPKNRQVEFYLTTDNVPMSSFFVPQLGSQIYTMAGMRTQLHLVATELGTYEGLNTQYNGGGFSDMRFTTKVVDEAELSQWFKAAKAAPEGLTAETYKQLRQPAANAPVQTYSHVEPGLFMTIIDSYQSPHHPA